MPRGVKPTAAMAAIIVVAVCVQARADSVQQRAQAILKASGIQGGLVVHLGCGNGALTAALRASDSYLVHGLDREDKTSPPPVSTSGPRAFTARPRSIGSPTRACRISTTW